MNDPLPISRSSLLLRLRAKVAAFGVILGSLALVAPLGANPDPSGQPA
ncbi:MAG: hypothetical protein ACJA2W_003558, partial [Planctomycetota bacterium]